MGLLYQPDWRDQPDELAYANQAAGRLSAPNPLGWLAGPSPLFIGIQAVELTLLDRLSLTRRPGERRAFTPFNNDAESVADRHLLLVVTRWVNLALSAMGLLFSVLGIRLLLGEPLALLWAALSALSLAQVREAQFATPVTPAVCASVFGLYGAARYVRGGSAAWAGASGAAALLAGCLYSPAIASLLLPIVAIKLRAGLHIGALLRRQCSTLLGLGEAVVLVYFLIVWPAFHQEDIQSALSRTLLRDLPTPELGPAALRLYPAGLAQSLGPATLGLAAAGLVLLLLRRGAAAELLGMYTLAWCVVLALHGGYQIALQIPLEIFATVCAAVALLRLAEQAAPARRPELSSLALVATLVLPAMNVAVLSGLTFQRDTRDAAWDWLQDSAAPMSHVRASPVALPQAALSAGPADDMGASLIAPEEVPYQASQAGCGEIIALDAGARSSLDSNWEEKTASARQFLSALGRPVARFDPGRGMAQVESSGEDLARPFWRLLERAASGPTVELYALQPSCQERAPLREPWEVLSIRKTGSGATLERALDPRFHGQTTVPVTSSPELPYPVFAAAVGRFRPEDHGGMLATLADEDAGDDELGFRQTLRVARLTAGLPPQPVVVDRAQLAGRGVPGGLAAVDLDGDGVDELAVLVRENTPDYRVDELIEIYDLSGPIQRVERWLIPSIEAERTIGIVTVPRDDDTPPGVLAVVSAAESETRVRLLRWSAETHVFQSLDGRADFVSLPERAGADGTWISIGDLDGDGRNELAALDDARSSYRVYKIPHGLPGRPALLDRWAERNLDSPADRIAALPPSAWSRAPGAPPAFIALESLVNRPTLTGYALNPTPTLSLSHTLDIPARSEAQSLTVGRFFPGRAGHLAILVRRDGRQQYLESWTLDDAGLVTGDRQTIDKWRAERTDSALDHGIAAADLDGNGRDELIIARQLGQAQQLEVLSIEPGPELSPRPLSTIIDAFPRDERFVSLTGVRLPGESRDSLAVLRSAGAQKRLEIYRIEPTSGRFSSVGPAQAFNARATDLAGWRGPSSGADSLLTLGREDALAKFVEQLAIEPNGQLESISVSRWYVLDERAVLWAGWR